MAPPRGEILARFDFPLYTLQFIDDKHFMVAGGGGGAKTGIPNAVEVFRFFSGRVQRVLRFQPEANKSEPIMNAALVVDKRRTVLAAGMGNECHLFSLRYKMAEAAHEADGNSGSEATKSEEIPRGDTEPTRNGSATGEVRHRRKGGEEEKNAESRKGEEEVKNAPDRKERNGFVPNQNKDHPRPNDVSFEVVPLANIRTDFLASKKPGDSYQKVVRFSPCGGRFFTGGTDGHLRCWNFPEVGTEPVYTVQVHEGCDVVDLDVSPDGRYIVTVGATDVQGHVWEAEGGNKHKDLDWKRDDYRFRGSRFGVMPLGGSPRPKQFRLFTIHCPKSICSKSDNYVTMWDSDRYIPVKSQATGRDMLSTLAVSDDGVFVGVGTRGGSIGIFIAFSLQKLHWVAETHAIFVTGLAFTPSSPLARHHVGDFDTSLVSISADNSAQIHHVPRRATISIVWVFAGCLLAVYLIFWLIAELGL